MDHRADWHAIEKLYVLGEVVGAYDDGTPIRRYPSIRDLARRFQLARSVVGNHSRRGGWGAERARFQNAHRDAMWKRLMAEELVPPGLRSSSP
jgi:hypothetical protein